MCMLAPVVLAVVLVFFGYIAMWTASQSNVPAGIAKFGRILSIILFIFAGLAIVLCGTMRHCCGGHGMMGRGNGDMRGHGPQMMGQQKPDSCSSMMVGQDQGDIGCGKMMSKQAGDEGKDMPAPAHHGMEKKK